MRRAKNPSASLARRSLLVLSALLLSAFFLLAPAIAKAEFRAFELLITNQETGLERTVITTMDHIQYPEYHPLNANETIQYVTSWMCWDRTNHLTEICPNPYNGPAPASVPKPNLPAQ